MACAAGPFRVKDCALVAIATGRRAQSLRQFHDGLQAVPAESIYYHFWGRLLRPRFDEPEFQSDFAAWARRCLHDDLLAERLAVIDPADHASIEDLRREVVEITAQRLEDPGHATTSQPDRQFHFRRCQTVVFDTGRELCSLGELHRALPALSLGSIYYHMIDARRRDPIRKDDFRVWLEQQDEPECREAAARLAYLDPFFAGLAELRLQLEQALACHAPA